MASLSIGSCKLGTTPRIVGIIDSLIPLNDLLKLRLDGVDIFEIRVDLIQEDFDVIVEYIQQVNESIAVPLIGTIRQTPHNKKIRLSLFSRIIPHIHAVDIEIDTPINKDVIALATKAKVIVSEHNYKNTPGIAALEKIVLTANTLGADIVKIATLAKTQSDVAKLLSFCYNQKTPTVAIAMGDLGTVSRITAPLFGSLFTYGCIGKSVAPGQIPLKQLIADIKRFYPNRQLLSKASKA